MPDAFHSHARRAMDPAVKIFSIQPDDGADLPDITTAVNVATPGTLRVTMLDGTIGDITVHPGVFVPVRLRRVWQTGTTATGIKGLT